MKLNEQLERNRHRHTFASVDESRPIMTMFNDCHRLQNPRHGGGTRVLRAVHPQLVLLCPQRNQSCDVGIDGRQRLLRIHDPLH